MPRVGGKGEHGWAQFAKNCRDGSDLYPRLVQGGGRLPMSLDSVLRIRVSLGILMSRIKCQNLSKKSRCMAMVVVFLFVVDVCQ